MGVVGLRIDGTRTGRLGYWVGRRFWGHGVATEAAGRLARWAFANLDLDRLEAGRHRSTTPPPPRCCAASASARSATGTEPFLARGAEITVLAFRGDARRHLRPCRTAAARNGSKPLLLVAACALIDTDGRVLLARRPEGKKMAGLWEFPGGKLHPGETPEAALIRELKEELGIDVAAACLAPFAFASHAYERFHLLMPLYLCRRWKGTPRRGRNRHWPGCGRRNLPIIRCRPPTSR